MSTNPLTPSDRNFPTRVKYELRNISNLPKRGEAQFLTHIEVGAFKFMSSFTLGSKEGTRNAAAV